MRHAETKTPSKAFSNPPSSHNTLGAVFIGESPPFIHEPGSLPSQDEPNRPQNTMAWVFNCLVAALRFKRLTVPTGLATSQSVKSPYQQITQCLQPRNRIFREISFAKIKMDARKSLASDGLQSVLLKTERPGKSERPQPDANPRPCHLISAIDRPATSSSSPRQYRGECCDAPGTHGRHSPTSGAPGGFPQAESPDPTPSG